MFWIVCVSVVIFPLSFHLLFYMVLLFLFLNWAVAGHPDTGPLGAGIGKHKVNDTDPGSQVNGKSRLTYCRNQADLYTASLHPIGPWAGGS